MFYLVKMKEIEENEEKKKYVKTKKEIKIIWLKRNRIEIQMK